MPTPIYTQDFDGSSSLPSGWNWPAEYSIATGVAGIAPISGANVLRALTNRALANYATWQTLDGVAGAARASAYFVAGSITAGNTVAVGVQLRQQSAAPGQAGGACYLAQLDLSAGAVSLSGSSGPLGSTVTLPGVAASQWYWLAVAADASNLVSVWVQRYSDGSWAQPGGTWAATQAACISVADGSPIVGQGYSGVYASTGSDPVYIDSYELDSLAAAAAPTIFPVARPPADPSRLWPPPEPRIWTPGLPAAGPAVAPGPGLVVPAPRAGMAIEEEPPRVVIAGRLPTTPPPVLPPPRAGAPPDEPGPRVFPAGALPEPPRPTAIFPAPAVAAPDPPPDARVALIPRLPSVGTPPPILVGPPGLPRPVLGVADDIAPRADAPRALPSAGTPPPLPIPPPGPSRVIAGIAEDIPPRAYAPRALPSVGVPASTGPGLLVPPTTIAHSWAAGGQLGGGGLLGAIPQYGNTSFSAPPGNGAFGDFTTGGDVGPGPAAFSPRNACALPSPGGATGGPTGGGASGPGGSPLALGGLGCCCGPTTVCVADCFGGPIASARVSLATSPGGTFAGGGITGPDGCGKVDGLPSGAHDYVATVTSAATGELLYRSVVTITSPGSATITPDCCVEVCLSACILDYSNLYIGHIITPPGAEVTVEALAGGFRATGVTRDDGCCTIPVPVPMDPGGYRVTMAYGGQSASTIIASCPAVPLRFTWSCWQVQGCAGAGLPGATASVQFNDGRPDLVQATDQYGNFRVLLGPGIVFSAINPGIGIIANIRVSAPRFVTFDLVQFYAGDYVGLYNSVGDAEACCTGIGLYAAPGYVCCGGVSNTPICDTLPLTDSVLGTCTLGWQQPVPGWGGANDAGARWAGKITVDYPGACGCPAAPVDVVYAVYCDGDKMALIVRVQGALALPPPPGSVNPCPCVEDAGAWCPGGGHQLYLALNPRQTSIAVSPLDVTFTGGGGCPCADTCAPWGATIPCGCGPVNPGDPQYNNALPSVWGTAHTSVTITVTDGCNP